MLGSPGGERRTRARVIDRQEVHVGGRAPALCGSRPWRLDRWDRLVTAPQCLCGDLRVKAQAWPWSVAQLDRAESAGVFVYPRAGEAEAPGELCGVEQFRAARRAGVDRLAFQAKELDDALGDLLDRVGRQLGGRAPSTCEAPSGTRLAGVCPRWMGVDWAECADGPAPPRWKCRECSHHRPLFVVAVSPHRASAVLAVSRSNRHCAFGPSPMRCPPSRCRCL